MDNGETLVAVLSVICAVGLPIVMTIFICYWVLTGKHKERMAMIERGIVPEEAQRQKANPNRYIALRNGMLMASLAIGALIGILIESCFTFTNEWHWLRGLFLLGTPFGAEGGQRGFVKGIERLTEQVKHGRTAMDRTHLGRRHAKFLLLSGEE